MRYLCAIVLAAWTFAPSFAGAADFYIGLIAYQEGDNETALREWGILAEEGHPESQLYLGSMHEYGHGVPKDLGQAAFWYEKSANHGNALAQLYIGRMHLYGRGVEQDPEQAVFWLREAAGQGHALAQEDLGDLYRVGGRVAQDSHEAAFWYRKAAEQGNAKAQHRLGELLLAGDGVPEDSSEATSWFRKSATQGNPDGRYSLAMMLLSQTDADTARNKIRALAWLGLAAAGGHVQARQQQAMLIKDMTAEQIEASKAVRYKLANRIKLDP